MSTPITIDDIYKLFQKSQEEFDRRVVESKAEADRSFAEIEKRLSKLEAGRSGVTNGKYFDDLANKRDNFVEDILVPSLCKLFVDKGMNIQQTAQSVSSQRHEKLTKIDILAVCEEHKVLLIEYQIDSDENSIDEFIEKLARFKVAFPHFKDYQAYGVVAGIEINEGIDRYAYQKGLFVIKPSGDSVAIANDDDFKPVAW